MNIVDLRKKYPKFVYNNYFYKINKKNLEIFFNFSIIPGIKFKPKIIIKEIKQKRFKKIKKSILDNLIFHLGLIELLSYWKTTCSPEIEIRAGKLNKEQIQWWKNLIIEGMGQFFYENKINWRKNNFLKIKSVSNKEQNLFGEKLKNRYLIPFAGGRDSIVTLENLILSPKKDISLFTVNPIEKIQKTVKISGIKKQIVVKREIDKNLLILNKKGYLNGHTPFTGLLSFLAVFCGIIFDYKNIVFSNEKSSNEGNVEYLGKTINHQWAKSSKFEKIFKKYVKKYLAKDINYFSFLRKKYDLDISKMFVKHPKYFPVFSSCNAGMKIGTEGFLTSKKRWCGDCPKCLFVFLSLYPFLDKKQIFKIFGENLFEKKELLPLIKDLVQKNRKKPFECVGTKKESLLALYLSWKRDKKIGELPIILKYFEKDILPKHKFH
jgi:UDP-N-acetyl-alpha-D-muramoyl-L-alanyl-L-glutamate epimerase